MSIALELVCCRYPDQDKDPVTSDSLVTTLSLLAPVIFSFCTPLLPFLSGPHLQHWRWLPRLVGNKILIHVSLYLVSLIILWCEGSGKGNVIGICGSGVRCGAGAGFWGGGPCCLVTYHWSRPQLCGASVGVSCVSRSSEGGDRSRRHSRSDCGSYRTVTAGRGKPRHNAPPPSVHHCHTTPLHHVTTTSYSYCRSTLC